MTSERANGLFGWRITQLENTVRDLEAKVDRLMWAIVGAALSFAVGVTVFALTVLTA